MGYVYALIAALLFGANGSVTRVIMESGLSPAQLTLFRVASATIISAAVLIVTDRRAFRVGARQLAILAVLGITGIALLQYSYAAAIGLLPVGITLLLEYTAVLMVALVAFLVFKERVRPRLWVAIGCVLAGLAIVAQVWASALNPLGVAFALLAAVTLTVYFVVGEREVGKTSPMAVAFWTMLFATVVWLIFGAWWEIDPGIFSRSVSLGGNLRDAVVPFWAVLAWSAVLGSFVPFVLSLRALGRLRATAAGIVASSEVLFAFLFAWLWLGEQLTAAQLVGVAIVLLGIILAQTSRAGRVVVDADLALAPPLREQRR